MASIVKRKNSRFWTACYTNRDGRQLKRSTKTTDKNQATEFAIEFALEAEDFKTSAGQLTAQMNAKLAGREICQPTHLVNWLETRAAGDDDFHAPRNFCRASKGIVSKSSNVRKSIVLN